MGKSAKTHKKLPKKTRSITAPNHPISTAPSNAKAQSAQERSRIKSKANSSVKTSKPDPSKGLLGGADYVSILMDGRRKARAEAQKAPQDPPSS
ncbi:hypothetical protein CPB83DRAFT_903083 [Crepidotus variabilis]|uniref:Uncharacterized protein n=1 Tax=Crepidotus variabilis TaxID=179855 RepID=A0A9P6EQI8_9AGAR|nr:hypothetical protein CPB83DRAFT_903083 [Crepidotus variabilis]